MMSTSATRALYDVHWNRMQPLLSAYRRARRLSWPAAYPIAQFPNPPLIIGLLALGLRYLASGIWATAFAVVGYAFVGAWAYLELTAGVNLFRRVLGAVGLVYVLVAIARLLPA